MKIRILTKIACVLILVIGCYTDPAAEAERERSQREADQIRDTADEQADAIEAEGERRADAIEADPDRER